MLKKSDKKNEEKQKLDLGKDVEKESTEKEFTDRENDSNKVEIEREVKNKVSESINDKSNELLTQLENAKNEINELEKQTAELKDSLLRKAAEFENYKRRNEIEQSNLIKYAAEFFILNILPIYNDLERSLNHIEDDNNNKSVKDGLKLVYDKFSKVLEEQGVKKIEAKGKPFDFNYHEALMQRQAEDVPPHTILEEIEPGYLYRDKVIRHSKVIVSQEPVSKEESKTVEEDKKEDKRKENNKGE
ncbi:MAG: nucleotide exchange factor GrpE [Ignavibacteria bacterium RBG_13_36_8]|nr:MAG: nucleotide exchange factor GrpE [Ignavibacteria bacterium RBG_13_36_8]